MVSAAGNLKHEQLQRLLVKAQRKAVEYLAKTSHANSDPYDIALIALAKLAAKEDASWERYIG